MAGFIQGNFNQQFLRDSSPGELKRHLETFFLIHCLSMIAQGWVCGLGHGVLPNTPEENVRLFVKTVREVLQ
jgi:uroporphyrinogen decarboxylase